MKCTSSRGLIKRAIPFFATFAFALLITSFFVDISGPRFGRGRHARRFLEVERLRVENEQLRDENEELRRGIGSGTGIGAGHSPESDSWRMGPELSVPMPPAPPPAPVAPHAHK